MPVAKRAMDVLWSADSIAFVNGLHFVSACRYHPLSF